MTILTDSAQLAPTYHIRQSVEVAYDPHWDEKPATYRYLVTLVHPHTGDEALLDLVVDSDRFSDMIAAITKARHERGLKGYAVFEMLETDTPF